MERDAYGNFNPVLWGVRYWGEYKSPFTFNIAVNDMSEVVKHQDRSIFDDAVTIPSSLDGGTCKVNLM